MADSIRIPADTALSEKYGDPTDIAAQFSLQVPRSIGEAALLNFDKIVSGDPFDINDVNRSIPIFRAAIGGKADNTYFYLVWDRLDESLYMRVVKTPSLGQKYDFRNEVEVLNHRIYPSLIEGNPTVAAQVEALKAGFSESELPDGAQMTYEILSLTQSQVTFDQKVFANSLESTTDIVIIPLPVGYITSISGPNTSGSEYIDGEVYDTTGGHGTGAQVIVSATPVTVTDLELQFPGYYHSVTLYETLIKASGYGSTGNGTELQISVQQVDDQGSITSFSISTGGSGYSVGDIIATVPTRSEVEATFVVTSVQGGEVQSVSIAQFGGTIKSLVDKYGQPTKQTEFKNANTLSGGVNYEVGDTLTISGGSGDVQVQVTSVVTQNNDVAESHKIDSFSFDNARAESLTIIHEGDPLQYQTSYKIIVNNVLNLAKQDITLEASATTSTAPVACDPITSILFEAYGSGSQSLTPLSSASYSATHSNNQFIYYPSGMTFSEFQDLPAFASIPLEVPESVTAPDKVYVWYKEGTRLLGDSAWIVGIIGDELDYNQDYTYVIYGLESVLNHYQLTPAGTSTYVCGTSEWGGDWGGTIQQFAINR